MRAARTGARLAAGLAIAALCAAIAGCGEEKLKDPPPAAAATPSPAAGGIGASTAPPPAVPAARMLVTRGFGAEVALDRAVTPGQSVMSALQTVAKVKTAYGGGFVQGIDGLEGDLRRGEDWLYFVNGVEAPVGSADREVRDGDVVWWDYRRWNGGYERVPAVVGSWPEPFVHGPDGTPPRVNADAPLDAALAAAGARVAPGADAPFRVLVGADADLRRRSPAWRAAAAAPRDASLAAWLDGGAGVVWDAAGDRAVPVPACRAVVAAVAPGGDASHGVDLVVAGVDAAAAQAAAAALADDPTLIDHAYAACLDAEGRLVARGGSAP